MIELSEEASKKIQQLLKEKRKTVKPVNRLVPVPRYDDIYFNEIKKMGEEETWKIE